MAWTGKHDIRPWSQAEGGSLTKVTMIQEGRAVGLRLQAQQVQHVFHRHAGVVCLPQVCQREKPMATMHAEAVVPGSWLMMAPVTDHIALGRDSSLCMLISTDQLWDTLLTDVEY